MNEFFKNPNVEYALIGGAVVAVIAFSQGAENVGTGIGAGAQDAGSGIGAGAQDAGIGIGAAAVTGVSIWAIGEYILPVLLL